MWTQAICEYAFPGFLFVLHLQFDEAWTTNQTTSSTQDETTRSSLSQIIDAKHTRVALPHEHVYRLLDAIANIHPDAETMSLYLNRTSFDVILTALITQITQQLNRVTAPLAMRRPRADSNVETLLAAASGAVVGAAASASSARASSGGPAIKTIQARDTLMKQHSFLMGVRNAWLAYKKLHMDVPNKYFRVGANHYMMAAPPIDWQPFTLTTLGSRLTQEMCMRVYLPALGITPESVRDPYYIQSRITIWVDRKREKKYKNEQYVKTCVPTALLAMHLESVDVQMRRAFYIYLVHELLEAINQLRECGEEIRAETPTRIELAHMCMPMQLDIDTYGRLLMDIDQDLFTQRTSSKHELDTIEFQTWSDYMTQMFTHTNEWQPDDDDASPGEINAAEGAEEEEEGEEKTGESITHQQAHSESNDVDEVEEVDAEQAEEKYGEAGPEADDQVHDVVDIDMQNDSIRDVIQNSRWFVHIDPVQYPDLHLQSILAATQDPAYRTPAYSTMRAMHDLLSASETAPERWQDIMTDATQQDAIHIESIITLFCKMFIRVHGTRWTSQLQRVLKQTDFLMHRLPPTHFLYTHVLAVHTRVYQAAQSPIVVSASSDKEYTLDEMHTHFKSLVVSGKRSRFTIQRIRWLLLLNASAAKLFRCDRHHTRDQVILELERTWEELDFLWRQHESNHFDAQMSTEMFTQLMQFAENAFTQCMRDADDALDTIGTWLIQEKDALFMGTIPTQSSNTEPRISFLPAHNEDAFDMTTPLHTGFQAAIGQILDNWIALDIQHHAASAFETAARSSDGGVKKTEFQHVAAAAASSSSSSSSSPQLLPQSGRTHANDMRLAWEKWLHRGGFAWQHDDRLRAALSHVKIQHQRILECIRCMGMEWPLCISRFYCEQMEKLQILQRETPRTSCHEWMNQIMCFHALLAWMHLFAL